MYKYLSFTSSSGNMKLLAIPVTKLEKNTLVKSFALKLDSSKIKGTERNSQHFEDQVIRNIISCL